ncbi:MAG: HD-GYP domain-containing protein [Defluviitaleaceae bacterium]|nr:HD-GYP domain-containing protein [Defluviitaleaceae bacterium]
MNGDAVMVKISEVKPSMVLARDAAGKNGVVLMASQTMLNGINYSILRSGGVRRVYVKPRSVDEAEAPFTPEEIYASALERQRLPVTSLPEFAAFSDIYEIRRDEAKSLIYGVSRGGAVDFDALYNVTNSIMASLRCKSDIFTFISYTREIGEHTYSHSVNVSLLCNLFGRWIGLCAEGLADITVAGLLHDIGKTMVPDEILNKNGPLTDEEFEVMKRHTVIGYEMLKNQDIPERIKLSALMHHEKIDGSGYPLGAKGGGIPDFAKIVAICDIYDAMAADRVYRKKICPFQVIKTFETNEYGELDGDYLLIFLQNIAYTYVGSWVRLSSGAEAEVVFINRERLARPLVKTADGEMIDLAKTEDIYIDSLV